jgi:hypothetical protein
MPVLRGAALVVKMLPAAGPRSASAKMEQWRTG